MLVHLHMYSQSRMHIAIYILGWRYSFSISGRSCRLFTREGAQATVRDDSLRLLVDPVELAVLVGEDLLRLEPEGNLLLGVLDAVGAVADVAADILEISSVLVSSVQSRRFSRLQSRSHHGWCRERRREGWWHREGLDLSSAVFVSRALVVERTYCGRS